MPNYPGSHQDLLFSSDCPRSVPIRSSFGLFTTGAFGVLLLLLLSTLAGCGSGGYAGGGIGSLSASTVTIDAGQSFAITSTASGGSAPVAWALSCSAPACGSLSESSGLSTIYTAPAGLSAQLKVTLAAALAGTQSRQTVLITVNPDPVISGTPPPGVVGSPYTATLVASGGTAALKWSPVAGSLPAGLTFNTATGVISGTPTASGTSGFSAQVVDSSDVPFTVSAPESIVVTMAAQQLGLSGNPPAGTVGTAYTAALLASGGTAPYTFTVLSGSLPAGLSLSAAGVISGIPTAAGTSAFSAQVQDASGLKATASFSIPIANANAALALSTSMLPNGTVGVPYSAIIGVSGGASPYTCVFTSGTLPAGLSLNGCVVSGTPTVAVVSNLTVKATDSSSPSATVSGPEAITIVAAPSLTVGTTAGGTVGVPYSGTIPVSGGTAPYSCVLTSGSLPAGLTLSGCVISGTPTTAGTSTATVKATDSANPAATGSGAVALTIAPAPLSISAGTLPNGTVGVTYSSTIGVVGGTSPYTCSITAGTLPAGLALGANCLVSGTPTTAGSSTLTVKATDASSPMLTTSGQVGITIAGATVLSITSPPNGTVGSPYTGSIPVSGGSAPYTCTLVSGTLPAGLTLGSGCAISGTPTVAGTSTLSVKATDSMSPATTSTATVSVTVSPAPLAITTGTLPNGTVGTPYSSTIGVSGGTAPYTCTITSGTLPAGLALGANCLVSGNPTVAGTSNLTVKATDSSNPNLTTTGQVGITISAAPLAITTGTLPNGTVGTPYSSTIGVAGGTAPYTCTITSGTLPAGLTLGANCLVSGNPTVAGTSSLTVKATDSSNPTLTTTGQVGITISAAPLAITTGTLPNGTVGTPYSSTIGVAGGTAPYTCTITSGTLPAGLTLGANCLVSGNPTVAGTSSLTVKATDSSNPTLTTTGQVGITISAAPLAITTGTLPNGTVGTPYSSTIGVAGGTAPYTCTITSGTLPAGLALGANCLVSGNPTVAGTSSLTVKATDSSNPTLTTTGQVGITISAAPLAITTGTLPNGTVGTPYSSTIGVSGGTAPYTCTITSGTLPAGLALGANCLVSGNPTVAGTSSLTVKATDSSNPTLTTTGQVGITISPAPLAITTGTLPNGTVGTPYSSTIGVSGGTAPYTCTITSGTLPAGLALGANCLVSGNPTVAGTSSLTVKATDSSNPTLTTTGQVGITISPAAPVLTAGTPPAGTVGTPYMGTIPVSGGTGPYTCTITSGTLPAGLALNGCSLSGTPTTPGTTTVTVGTSDSSNPKGAGSGPVTITINNPGATLALSNPPAATVGTPYTGIIPVSGGTAPYTCTLNSGTVPAGLTLTNCTLTGTPTTAVTSTLNLTAADSGSPKGTVTGPVVVTVNPAPALTFTGSLQNGVVGVQYTQTLAATGGIAPYTYAVTTGTLNPGLSLDPATGIISGIPTTPGASSFTVTATDSETPKQTASLPLVLLITYATTANDSELKGPYAFLFQGYDDVAAGLFAYQTATAGSFTADGAGGILNGELDSNHQGSTPAGATIASNSFLGTYTLGTDNRGLLTITTLNADGTTAQTSTYAIAVKAPVAPATTTAQGSMIEFDNDQLRGTKGSGSFLQQTAASFTTGLTGSYAFGLGGDTPCLPTCTVGIVAGPVASVGQFTVAAGAITGSSDANIANIKYTNQGLSGTYGTADGNGRVQLSLATAGTPTGIYPTDYAVYLVDANHAFVLSTDKHSAAILLAGTAQSQTLPTYGSTSLTGPFIGYENAATNPGLVGATLANTLNLSTATIFRATGDGAGTCSVTNVDTGGVTQLVNGLTGLGSGAPVINALLGTYQSTGAAACSVSSNGRGILNYPVPSTALTATLGLLGITAVPPPARVVYLASADRGYFLETGYAGLGQIEPQTGAPFSLATFNGTFLYGEAPASSVATINASGFIIAHGDGTATSDEDLNLGVGTLNVLQVGTLHNDTYTPPDQTSGRFVLNDTTVIDQSVVYVISPGRFVLLDTNPATTSPSVNVLY